MSSVPLSDYANCYIETGYLYFLFTYSFFLKNRKNNPVSRNVNSGYRFQLEKGLIRLKIEDQALFTITLPRKINSGSEKSSDGIDATLVDNRFDLLRSFALTSLLVMLIIGGLSGTLFSSYLSDSLLRRDAEVSQAILLSLTEVEGGPEMFRLDHSQSNFTRKDQPYDLPELADHIATMPGVVRTNIYSTDGKVLWSTRKDLIGKRFPANHELEEALQGKVVFELQDIKEEQKAEYADFGSDVSQLVENYLPIWDFRNNTVAAVVEIYKAPKSLFDALRSARNLVWISVAGATLFLYASLFWVVYRANLLIRSQQFRLIESETMVAIGEMASAVAHSIRNPLAAIRSGAELTTETSEDKVVCETAQDIITEIDRVELWVRELLIFSRPDGTTQFSRAYLDQILTHCLTGHKHVIKSNNVKVRCTIDPGIPAVKGDSSLLGQMLNSILDNALEAMLNGGTLTLEGRTAEQEKMVQISISDTGNGIPRERLETLFQLSSTTKQYGLGIGMLLVKRIVERHGGSISLSSQVGVGTTALISLPMA